MNRMPSSHRRMGTLITICAILLLAVLWQILSLLFTAERSPGRPLVPGWQILFTDTYLSLSDYWYGGLGFDRKYGQGQQSYWLSTLTLISHSIDSWRRLLIGLFFGAFLGVGLGLALSWSIWVRQIARLPSNFLRQVPLLAMIPLFQYWFGMGLTGAVIFIAWGVGVIFLAGTVNAVENVDPLYLQYARTLGASRWQIYRDIITPAIFPELRGTVMLSLGMAWSALLGAEFLGAQSGLGHIIVFANLFALVDRMFIVSLLFIIYAVVSYITFMYATKRFSDWI